MAFTSSFSFTNITPSENKVAPINIDPVTDYAKTEDEATECSLKNKTCALGQGELLSFSCVDIKNVSTKQPILNPAKNTSGVQYICRLDEILRTTHDETGEIICDEPIVMYLTVRHNVSSFITPDHIKNIFQRLAGALKRDDGSYRFDDLMLSALAPTQN